MKHILRKKALSALLSVLLAAAIVLPGGLALTGSAAYAVSDAYLNSPYYAAVNAVELTGDTRTDLLNVARSQLGYIEGGEEGDFGGGGGTGVRDNYTEYIYWYFGDPTAHGDNYAWCAAFVSWCANKAGISQDTIPKFARVQPEGEATFRSWGRFRGGAYVPEPGDLIFYSGHVGIVESTDEYGITSIEGNHQDMVTRRKNAYGSKAILGYGVLSDEPAPWPAYLPYPGTLQRVGSDGLVVRWLQRALNDLGFACGNPDGIFGNNTKNAVLAFQEANGLSADGIAGNATWGKLWEKLHEKYPGSPTFNDDVHIWKTAEETLPTCSDEGYRLSVCAVEGCGAEKEETLSPVPGAHVFRVTVTEPTCTEGGYTTYACTRCRYGYSTDETDPTGHAYGIRITPATCTQGGITTLRCVHCGDTITKDPTPPLGHTDGDGDGLCDYCREPVGQPENLCVCGKTHEGPLGAIIRFFHKIVYFFRNLFGMKVQ